MRLGLNLCAGQGGGPGEGLGDTEPASEVAGVRHGPDGGQLLWCFRLIRAFFFLL